MDDLPSFSAICHTLMFIANWRVCFRLSLTFVQRTTLLGKNLKIVFIESHQLLRNYDDYYWRVQIFQQCLSLSRWLGPVIVGMMRNLTLVHFATKTCLPFSRQKMCSSKPLFNYWRIWWNCDGDSIFEQLGHHVNKTLSFPYRQSNHVSILKCDTPLARSRGTGWGKLWVLRGWSLRINFKHEKGE